MKLSDIPPALFTIIAEALGVFVAERLRLNQQNSVGNWFELFGQVIETYNAQQQLIQQGPGSLPGRDLNKELAKSVANEPLQNFAYLLSQNALSQSDVQQELSSGDGTPSDSSSSASSSPPAAISMPSPMMQSGEVELLKQQVASLTEEVLQLKNLLLVMQNSLK